jgi:formylglycine-generating enzyme required for sulfatase activity
MAGNASQWVADTYHATYLGAPADASPWVDPNPAGAGPVFRGGDWAADATYALASHRCHNAAYAAFDTMGLRPVRGAP